MGGAPSKECKVSLTQHKHCHIYLFSHPADNLSASPQTTFNIVSISRKRYIYFLEPKKTHRKTPWPNQRQLTFSNVAFRVNDLWHTRYLRLSYGRIIFYSHSFSPIHTHQNVSPCVWHDGLFCQSRKYVANIHIKR